MLSGEFTTVAIDSIWLDRSSRIRKEITLSAIEEKSESIRRLGLIHPLVITRELKLVSGETRLCALRALGWSHAPIQYSDTLDERELLAIELEENIKRTDLTWKEQCDALLKFHNLQREVHDGKWSQEQTADAIGISQATVANQLGVAGELSRGNARVVAAKEYSVAVGIVKRQRSRAAADELSSILGDEGHQHVRAEDDAPDTPIQTANFLEWVVDYSGPSFNFIHCDAPYGVNADKFNQGAADAYGGYEDSFETYEKIITALCDNRDKLLGTSGHVIWWFSMKHYQYTLDFLSKHFWIDPVPLIWFKNDNKGTLPDAERGPRRVYETAFFCSHGDRKIIQSVSNVCAAPVVRTGEHMSEKNADMLKHFFRMTVDENTRILDPTCGSGSALRAARMLGATDMLGLELNNEYAENARRAWRNN